MTAIDWDAGAYDRTSDTFEFDDPRSLRQDGDG
jgi:hypothetical protein